MVATAGSQTSSSIFGVGRLQPGARNLRSILVCTVGSRLPAELANSGAALFGKLPGNALTCDQLLRIAAAARSVADHALHASQGDQRHTSGIATSRSVSASTLQAWPVTETLRPDARVDRVAPGKPVGRRARLIRGRRVVRGRGRGRACGPGRRRAVLRAHWRTAAQVVLAGEPARCAECGESQDCSTAAGLFEKYSN